MPSVSSMDLSARQRRTQKGVLALCWVSGLAAGIAVCLGAGDSLFPLMRSTAQVTVSIVRALFAAVFPFLITAFAVSFSRAALLLICFGKAFLFSFTAMGLQSAFGSAGWLHCRMALFSDLCMLPLLYLLWLRLMPERRRVSMAELLAVLAFSMLIVSIDHRIVSSLWAFMIEIQKGSMG